MILRLTAIEEIMRRMVNITPKIRMEDNPSAKLSQKLETQTHQGAASISSLSYHDNDARKRESLAVCIKMSICVDMCAVWNHQCLVVLLVSIDFRIYLEPN
jgi:hypothetical protein